MFRISNGEVYIDGAYYGIDSAERAYNELWEKKERGEQIDEEFLQDLSKALDYFHDEC